MTAVATATRTIRRFELGANAGVDGQHHTGTASGPPLFASGFTATSPKAIATDTDTHNVAWGSNRVAPSPTGPGLPLSGTPPLATQASRDRAAANYGNNQAAYVNPNGIANGVATSTGSGGTPTTPPTLYGA